METITTNGATTSAEKIDRDIVPHPEGARPAPPPPLHRLWAGMDLSRVLRWSGGIVLTAAGVCFMFQGLYSFTPLTRHWMLLIICSLLGAMGLLTGMGMRETKGARSFLAFTVASFPVLASQLGAMVFSLFGQPPPGMPQPLVFSFLTAGQVAGMVGLTLAVMVPLCQLGFKILARPQATRLTALYTLSNLCILLPLREGPLLGILIAVMGAGLYYADTTTLVRDFRLATFEGRLSRGLLALPLLVLFGRSLFYPVGHAYIALILGMAGAYLSFHWGRLVQNPTAGLLLQLAGNAGLAAGWLTWMLPLIDATAMGDGAVLYVVFLPIAVCISLHAALSRGRLSRGYLHTAAAMVSITVLYAHLIDGALMLSAVGLGVGIVSLAGGVLTASKWVLMAGGAATLISLSNFARMALVHHAGYAWMMLAVAGILVLFSASLAEKNKGRWRRNHLAAWGQLKR